MRVLLDADVLLDFALGRAPWAEDASNILALCELGHVEGFIAWHSVANINYIVYERGKRSVRKFFNELLSFLRIARVDHASMLCALDLDMSHLEDAMQVAAALACGATYTITRNIRHYRKSPIPATTPSEFLQLWQRKS